MTVRAGYTGSMKRVSRGIVIWITLVILVLAVASCLITPPTTAADDQAADSGVAEGTTAGSDPESAGDGVGAADSEFADEIGPLTPGVVAKVEETPLPQVDAPGNDPPKPDEIPLRVLAAGSQSAVRVPVAGTITSQVVLEEVWFAMHANQLSPPAVPEVDFGSETVIILILGERPSAGYSVRAAETTLRDSRIEVRIAVSSPGPDVMTASVLTSPFQLSAIEITGVPVTFVGEDLREGYDDGW